MKYRNVIVLNDGSECLLRNAEASDAQAVYDIFCLTHEQTEHLLTYPDENSFDLAQERQFLIER